jgi:hypothetical protein
VMLTRCSGTLAPAISTSHSSSSPQSAKSVSHATPPSRATVPEGRRVLSARCQSREPAGLTLGYVDVRQIQTLPPVHAMCKETNRKGKPLLPPSDDRSDNTACHPSCYWPVLLHVRHS